MTFEEGKFINKTENNYLYYFYMPINEFGNKSDL